MMPYFADLQVIVTYNKRYEDMVLIVSNALVWYCEGDWRRVEEWEKGRGTGQMKEEVHDHFMFFVKTVSTSGMLEGHLERLSGREEGEGEREGEAKVCNSLLMCQILL